MVMGMKFKLTQIFLTLALLIMPVVAYPQSSIEEKIEDHFRLYMIQDGRRSKSDKVRVKKTSEAQVATLYYWRNLEGRNPADVICDAYQWLLQGRTRYGKGVKSAFAKFSNVQAFELMFYDLEFGTKRGKKKGAFFPAMKAKQYMRVRITRPDLKKVNFKKTWIDQQIKDNNCPALKELFDKVSFDQNYMRQKV